MAFGDVTALHELLDRGPEFLSCTSDFTGVCESVEKDRVTFDAPGAEDYAQPCPGTVLSFHSRQLADDSPCPCDRWCEDSALALAVESSNLHDTSVKLVSFDPLVEVREFSDEDSGLDARPVVFQPLQFDDVVAPDDMLHEPVRYEPEVWDLQASCLQFWDCWQTNWCSVCNLLSMCVNLMLLHDRCHSRVNLVTYLRPFLCPKENKRVIAS